MPCSEASCLPLQAASSRESELRNSRAREPVINPMNYWPQKSERIIKIPLDRAPSPVQIQEFFFNRRKRGPIFPATFRGTLIESDRMNRFDRMKKRGIPQAN